MFFEALLFFFMMKTAQDIEDIDERLTSIESPRFEREDEELEDLR